MTNFFPILLTITLGVLLAGCSPSMTGSTFSSPTTVAASAVQPTSASCVGTASGTLTTAPSTLNVSIDEALGTARSTFAINGRQYAMSGTATPASGGQYLDLSGTVDGGRVTGNLLAGFTGNYKATINNYRLSMRCA